MTRRKAQRPKYHGRTTRTYRYIPAKYERIYDLFMTIIQEREKIDPTFVCGIVTYQNNLVPGYFDPSLIPAVCEV